MSHQVAIDAGALADMKRTYTFLAREVSRVSAEKWYRGVLGRVASLENDPEKWPLAEEADELGFDLRMILYRRYRHVHRILFRVEGDQVHVLRVRHAAQDSLTAEDF